MLSDRTPFPVLYRTSNAWTGSLLAFTMWSNNFGDTMIPLTFNFLRMWVGNADSTLDLSWFIFQWYFFNHRELYDYILYNCIILNDICHDHCYVDVSPTSGLTHAEMIWHNYDVTYSACNTTLGPGRREPIVSNGRMGKTTNGKANDITVITLPKWYRKEFDLSLNHLKEQSQ